MDSWMIMYKLENGVYEPFQYGSNLVPTDNIDKVIQVPEEIAVQATKFNFDGTKLIRKEGEHVLTLEELREKYRQEEIELNGSVEQQPDSNQTTEIVI